MMILPVTDPLEQRALELFVKYEQLATSSRSPNEVKICLARAAALASEHGFVRATFHSWAPAPRILADDCLTVLAGGLAWWRSVLLIMIVDFAGKSANPDWRLYNLDAIWSFERDDVRLHVCGARATIEMIRVLYAGGCAAMAMYGRADGFVGPEHRAALFGMLNSFGAELGDIATERRISAAAAPLRRSCAMVPWVPPKAILGNVLTPPAEEERVDASPFPADPLPPPPAPKPVAFMVEMRLLRSGFSWSWEVGHRRGGRIASILARGTRLARTPFSFF